jgi:hypothetical protein
MQTLLRVVALVSLAGSAAAAQSVSEIAAFNALMFTPIGGLPPIMTSSISADVQRSAQLAFRYGYISGNSRDALFGGDLNSFGISGLFPMGVGSTFSLTGGVSSPQCDECDASLMLSVGGDMRLTSMPMGTERDAARLTISLNGEFGFGKPKVPLGIVSSVWSGAVGLPIGLVSGGGSAGMRIVPFITPAFGFGNVDFRGDIETESGSRFMLGGGVGIYNRTSSVALNVGFQYIPIDNGGTQIGLALMIGGR